MDGARFDRLTQQLGHGLNRRRFGALLAALGVGGGLGAASSTKLKAKKKGKKKKKAPTCPAGTVLCGGACVDTQADPANCGSCGNRCGNNQTCVGGQCRGGGCVDTQSNAQHCGGCGNACQGALTCISGQCGCAAGTKCGNQCVNTQTDDANCGSCGNGCTSGKRCQGGQCVDQPECTSQAQCGGSSSNDLVCRNGRCLCPQGQGLCHRFPDGRGTCHICCPGGSEECPGNRNEICFYYQTPSEVWAGLCDCATGSDRCPDGLCVADTQTDPRHCGQNCQDCQARLDVNPKRFCCDGRCAGGGCRPGFGGGDCIPGSPDIPCGSGCQPCSAGMLCCNRGPGTEGRCIPDTNRGSCY
jgi:hypothetical protein